MCYEPRSVPYESGVHFKYHLLRQRRVPDGVVELVLIGRVCRPGSPKHARSTPFGIRDAAGRKHTNPFVFDETIHLFGERIPCMQHETSSFYLKTWQQSAALRSIGYANSSSDSSGCCNSRATLSYTTSRWSWVRYRVIIA